VRGQRHAAPAAPYPRVRPGTHCTGGWLGLRADLDRCGKSRPTGIRSPDRPAPRQLLYRLRYPARVVEFNPIIFHEGMGRGGIDAYFYPSLISPPNVVVGRHAVATLPPGTRHFFHFTGDWTDIKNLTLTRVRTSGLPDHSEPLYRLHYSRSP